MKFNPVANTLGEALGISNERELELDALGEAAIDNVTSPDDPEKFGEGWSPLEAWQAVAHLPQTPEEAFYVGSMAGSMITEGFHNAKIAEVLMQGKG